MSLPTRSQQFGAVRIGMWQINRVLQALSEKSDDYIAAFSRGLFSPGMVARIATANRTANGVSSALIEVGTKGIDRVVVRMNRSASAVAATVVLITTVITMTLMIAQMSVTSDLDNAGPQASTRSK